MHEVIGPNQELDQLDLSGVDTYVFDYGGVISFHYCDPWQSNLSTLLGIDSEKVRGLLSESSVLGRDYRLGLMTRDEFWQRVISDAGSDSPSPSELEFNWAMTYQLDHRMMKLVERLRAEGIKVGLLSNSDQYRQDHNERVYGLSKKFDFIISSHTHGVVKPEIDAYKAMLEVASRVESPEKVIYIDDREKNVKPGYELGMKGYVFDSYENFAMLLNNKGVLSFAEHD